MGSCISCSCLTTTGLYRTCKLSSLARCCSAAAHSRDGNHAVWVLSPDRVTQGFYLKGQRSSVDLGLLYEKQVFEEGKVAEACTAHSEYFGSDYKHHFDHIQVSRCLHMAANGFQEDLKTLKGLLETMWDPLEHVNGDRCSCLYS